MYEDQLRQQFAGQALNGMLASPRWSSMLIDGLSDRVKSNESEVAREFMDTLVKIAWNIADAMVVEGRERGHVETPRDPIAPS